MEISGTVGPKLLGVFPGQGGFWEKLTEMATPEPLVGYCLWSV